MEGVLKTLKKTVKHVEAGELIGEMEKITLFPNTQAFLSSIRVFWKENEGIRSLATSYDLPNELVQLKKY